ncbi:MAG TPA: hypothetical protein VJC03_05670, partial [bacterium]|nr:hypothetical protein [bacterium]
MHIKNYLSGFKLFHKIFFSFIFVVFLVSGFLSRSLITVAQKNLKVRIFSNLDDLSVLFSKIADDYFSELNREMTFVTEWEANPRLTLSDKYKILTAQLLKTRKFTGLLLLDSGGREIMRVGDETWSELFPGDLISKARVSEVPELGAIFYRSKTSFFQLVYPIELLGRISEFIGALISLDSLTVRLGAVELEEGVELL